ESRAQSVCLNAQTGSILRGRTHCAPLSALCANETVPSYPPVLALTYLKPGQAMVTKEDIQGFLDRISAAEGASYREVETGLGIRQTAGRHDVLLVVKCTHA